jgi:hypothetical protein
MVSNFANYEKHYAGGVYEVFEYLNLYIGASTTGGPHLVTASSKPPLVGHVRQPPAVILSIGGRLKRPPGVRIPAGGCHKRPPAL